MRAGAGCWVLCWNSTGRKKGTLFHSFFSLAATTPVDLDGVCVFFSRAPTNSARTFTRGILASDPLGGEGGVTPSWWCRLIATFRHIFSLLFDIFKEKGGKDIFFVSPGLIAMLYAHCCFQEMETEDGDYHHLSARIAGVCATPACVNEACDRQK